MALETLVLPPPETTCHSDNDWSILHAILRFLSVVYSITFFTNL